MADFPFPELVYFAGRLNQTAQTTGLPASVQYDMAKLPLDKPALAQATTQFGAKPPGGFGLSGVLDHIVATRPDTIAVGDLSKLQQNLKQTGYLPPSYVPTGTWDPVSQTAFSQFENDASNRFYEGNHPLSTSFWHAIAALGWVMPSNVFKGIVGAAKGFVQQTPETVERVGALGGAAAGAALGGTLGSVIPGAGTAAGAAIGAGIGAVVGFFGDLFSHDSDEQGQSALGAVWDALTPFQEYSGQGGAQRFFEDLGWVGTGVSLIEGGSLAGKAAISGVAGISGAAEAAGTDFLKAGLAKTGVNEQMGIMSKILSAPVKWFDADAYSQLTNFIKANGVIAQQMRPLIGNVLVPAYTGISAAQFGARLSGGIGSGNQETTIEKAIRTAPELPGASIVDNTLGFVLYPTQLLPVKLGDISAGAQAFLGSDFAMKPFINWYRYNNPMSTLADASAAVRTALGRSPAEQRAAVLSMHLEHGVEMMAAKRVVTDLGIQRYSEHFASALEAAKYNIRSKIIGEAGSINPLEQAGEQLSSLKAGTTAADMPTLREAMSYTYFDAMEPAKGPASFESYLFRLGNSGSGPERVQSYFDANRILQDFNERMWDGEVLPTLGTGKPPVNAGYLPRPEDQIASLSVERESLNAQADRMEQVSRMKTASPQVALQMSPEVRVLRERADAIGAQIKELKKTGKASWSDRLVVAQRTDTPGRSGYTALAKEYTQLWESAANTAIAEQSGAHQLAVEQLRDWVHQHEDLIPPKMVERAMEASTPSKDIAGRLKKLAQSSATEVQLPEPFQTQLTELGYKPVLVHKNNFLFQPSDKLIEVMGLGDYTRREAFFDSIGLGISKDSTRSISRLRDDSTRAEIASWLEQKTANGEELPIEAPRIMNRLYDALRERNYAGVVRNSTVRGLNPLEKDPQAVVRGGWVIPQGGGLMSGKKWAVDIRDLTVDDVFESLRDLEGFTFDDAKTLYGALRRGAAFGTDLSFRHPLATGKTLGRALRADGLPGVSNALRAWHAEVPYQVPHGLDGWSPKVQYRPTDDLLQSAERDRAVRELRDTAAKAGFDRNQTTIAEMMLDATAHGAVASNPERYPTVDDFFRLRKFGFADSYDGASGLYKRVGEAPNFDELKLYASTFDDSKEWYEKSAKALADAIPGGKTQLRDGSYVDNYDLFAQVLAATSPLRDPTDNLNIALDVLLSHLKDGDYPAGLLPNSRLMLDDILSGNTIDRWKQPHLTTKTGAPSSARSRLKVFNFYNNLMGHADNVTVDTWMARLWKIEGSPTAAQYDEISGAIKDVADDLGWKPMQVQAALWRAVKEETANDYLALARNATVKGDAAKYKRIAADVRDARSYSDLLEVPNVAEKLEKLNGYSLLKQVGDDVRGMTTFGPDYGTTIKLFRSGDFGTLVHEYGHMLRRLLPEEQARAIEDTFGAVRTEFAHSSDDIARMAEHVGGETAELAPLTDDIAHQLYADAQEGGFTFDPHTGTTYTAKKGYAVAIGNETAGKVSAGASFEEFKAKLDAMIEHYRPLLERKRVHIGAWLEDGEIHLDPSEVVGRKPEAMKLGAARRQQGVFNFKNFETIPVDESKWAEPIAGSTTAPGVRWSREAEEKFADAFEQYLTKRIAEASQPEHHAFEGLRTALGHVWSRFRGQVRDKGLIPTDAQKVWEQWFKDIYDPLKPTAAPRGRFNPAVKRVALATAGGAALGAIEGDDKVHDALLGAGGGLAVGMGLEKLLGKAYGYLPDYLYRVGSAMRYAMSPGFDVRRWTKGNVLAMTKYDLPFIGNARRYITSKYGQDGWKEALDIMNEMHGVKYLHELDEFDRTLHAGGITGYSPLLRQAAYAMELKSRGWDADHIAHAMRELFSYGTGRTALEKSINFMFFPFSFEKKLMTTMGDFLLQQPARAMLVHEGLMRYHRSQTSKDVNDILERHFPILEKLSEFNAFAHGIGPGRFFLQGIVGSPEETHRTADGKAAQILANFFIPGGGALTPFQETVGGLGDFAHHAFSPVAVTGESITRLTGSQDSLTNGTGLDQLLEMPFKLMPLFKDLDEVFGNAGDQIRSLTHGESPFAQFRDYTEQLGDFRRNLEPIAYALGYSSPDGLLASDLGAAFRAEKAQLQYELGAKYPDAVQLMSRFDDTAPIERQALAEVMNKPNPSPAEEAIQQVGLLESQGQLIINSGGLDPSVMQPVIAGNVRQYALQHADDPQFVQLYNELFAWKYGPIRMVA